MNAERDANVLEHLLVLRAQLGHHDAMRALFERYNSRLLYYLRRMVDDEAEDVLQEVWMKVVRNVGGLERPAAFKAWVYRTAHNQAISRIRSQPDDMALEELSEEPAVPSPGDETDDTALFGTYGGASLHLGLSRLTAHHREVLTLRFLEELSYEEVAGVVGCSIGTVRSRIHYAKKSLLHSLENSDKDADSS